MFIFLVYTFIQYNLIFLKTNKLSVKKFVAPYRMLRHDFAKVLIWFYFTNMAMQEDDLAEEIKHRWYSKRRKNIANDP